MDITALKAQHDIVQIVNRTVELKKQGYRYVGLCPLHKEEHPSLTVYPDRQSFKCFGCKARGDVINWLMLSLNIDFKTAIKLLGNLPEIEPQPLFKPQIKRIRSICQEAAQYWHSKLGKRRIYYHNRGFANNTINREQFGWTGRRYVIPLWTGTPQESRLAAVKLRRDDEGEMRRLQENGLDGDILRSALKLIPRYVLRGNYEPLLYNRWAVEGKEEVWVFFGEFDAQLATQLGLNACSPVHGANSWQSEWSDNALRFARKVYVVPDKGERSQGFDAKAMIGGHAVVIKLPNGDWTDFSEFILAGHHPSELLTS